MSMLSKLKQFKDLREQGKKLQNALSGESVTVTELGGKVTLVMDGNMQVSSLTIDPELLNPSYKEKLEKALKEAYGEALKKIQRIVMTKMQQSGDFKLPGLN